MANSGIPFWRKNVPIDSAADIDKSMMYCIQTKEPLHSNFNLWNFHFAPKHKLKYSKSAIENAITNGISLGIYRTTNYFRSFFL
jgi:hypothetical protein